MNYRHIYHAGNFADVFKHVLLVWLVDYLALKPAPFFVLDTHAGGGRYDLQAPQAQRTGEYRLGIGRLWDRTRLGPALARYLALVRACGAGTGPEPVAYPGSPLLVRRMLRAHDRLVAAELHPEDGAALAGLFRHDRQVTVRREDGYRAVLALLPPAERRGLVFVDPPFESGDEFDRMTEALVEGHRRWATGVFAFWYPIKDEKETDRFLRETAATGVRRILDIEFLVDPGAPPEALRGCGMVVVNPPWTLTGMLDAVLPELSEYLGRGGARGHYRWVVPE